MDKTRSLASAIIAALACVAASCSSPSHAESAKLVGVATVIDGDTIEIHGTRVRLSGFDAPESGSRCGGVNVYQKASFALSDLIGSHTVSCALTGKKTYDREVGTCSVAGRDLGDMMVESGWARDWPRYSHGKYADEEAKARVAKRGLWAIDCPGLWGSRDYSR